MNKERNSVKTLNSSDWFKIIVSTFILFVGLNYYIETDNTSIFAILIFSFLSVWITWQDLKGYIIRDKILMTVFCLISLFLSNKTLYEFCITMFIIASLVMIADYLSTGYRFSGIELINEPTERITKFYFGKAGYLIGWTQSMIILLLAYMLFPIEENEVYQSICHGWELFIKTFTLPFLIVVILSCILLIQHKRKSVFEKKNPHITYYKNVRPHTVWLLGCSGAMMGFPATLTIILFSFVLYFPAYIFCSKNSDTWIKEVTVKFFSYKRRTL